MRIRVRSAVALVVLATYSFACVSTQLPPMSVAGASFHPLPDEIELWEEAREEQDALLREVTVKDDPELVAYLEDVVAGLTPPALAAHPSFRYRVFVIDDPTLNAFAYPDGTIFLHTGLLARLENEDQLATVLGHEMSHVEHRHMLRHRRAAHNREVGLTVASVAAAVVLAAIEADEIADGHFGRAAAIDFFGDVIVTLGLELALVAAVNGYGRELEHEADRGGFHKLRAAGYDVREAPRVYELLGEDHDDAGATETFFFGSHPRLAERHANAVADVAKHPPALAPTAGDRVAFAAHVAPLMRDEARKNIALDRPHLACSELAAYLRLAPEAPDAEAVRAERAALEQEGHCGT